MGNATLLSKARDILAHAKQGPPTKTRTKDAGDDQIAMIGPASPNLAPGGSASPHTAPSTSTPAIKSIEIQPAAPNAKPIHWETGTGDILGPAKPEFLARDGNSFWIVTTFEGQLRWINADRLRSQSDFRHQASVSEIAIKREGRL